MNDGMNDAATVAARLAETRARITAAGGGPGVEILAVTKAFGPEVVDIAAAAGCAAIGENYAQELLTKRSAIADHPGLGVHFIGQLQTNKVRQLAGLVTVYETVDRAKLAREIAKRARTTTPAARADARSPNSTSWSNRSASSISNCGA